MENIAHTIPRFMYGTLTASPGPDGVEVGEDFDELLHLLQLEAERLRREEIGCHYLGRRIGTPYEIG